MFLDSISVVFFEGPKKQNPRSGSRPGVENSLVGVPFEVGAGWVSGAPVAKPIPVISVELEIRHRWSNAHSHSFCRATGAGMGEAL